MNIKKMMKIKVKHLFLFIGAFISLILFLRIFKIIENFAAQTTTSTSTTISVGTKSDTTTSASTTSDSTTSATKASSTTKKVTKAPVKAAAKTNSITCTKGKTTRKLTGKGTLKCPSGFKQS